MKHQDKPIRLISVNIEGNKHLEERIIPFLIRENPDVVTLQEVFEQDLPRIAKALKMKAIFAPMRMRPMNYSAKGEALNWGIAILSRLPILDSQALYYDRSADDLPTMDLPSSRLDNVDFDGIYDDNAKVLLKAKIDNAGEIFNLATTHFTWTPNGQPTPQQGENLARLKEHLVDEDLIFTGDTNSPRGGPIWTALNNGFTDWIPPHIETTIDGKHHRAGQLMFVVDALSTRGYRAENVQLVDDVSDHLAVLSQIYKLTTISV